jgi:hypothetical protein
MDPSLINPEFDIIYSLNFQDSMDPSLRNPDFDRSGVTEDHFKFRNFPKLKFQDWKKTDFSKKKIAKRIHITTSNRCLSYNHVEFGWMLSL